MTIQLKRNTAAGAAANNEILADGQPGWDKTNGILKIGDGTTHWNDLPVAMAGVFLGQSALTDNGDFAQKLVRGAANTYLAKGKPTAYCDFTTMTAGGDGGPNTAQTGQAVSNRYGRQGSGATPVLTVGVGMTDAATYAGNPSFVSSGSYSQYLMGDGANLTALRMGLRFTLGTAGAGGASTTLEAVTHALFGGLIVNGGGTIPRTPCHLSVSMNQVEYKVYDSAGNGTILGTWLLATPVDGSMHTVQALVELSSTSARVTFDGALLSGGSVGNAWLPSHAYTVGTQVINGSKYYTCTTAGTSASSGGPTGTGTGITDGSVVWSYLAAAATIDSTGTVITHPLIRCDSGTTYYSTPETFENVVATDAKPLITHSWCDTILSDPASLSPSRLDVAKQLLPIAALATTRATVAVFGVAAVASSADGATTNASPYVTSATAAFVNGIGKLITGTNVAAGSYITDAATPAGATAWAATTAYTLGLYRRPTAANGHLYRCTTAGTSAGSEPTWPTGGGTVTDGTAVWTDLGTVNGATLSANASGTGTGIVFTLGAGVHLGSSQAALDVSGCAASAVLATITATTPASGNMWIEADVIVYAVTASSVLFSIKDDGAVAYDSTYAGEAIPAGSKQRFHVPIRCLGVTSPGTSRTFTLWASCPSGNAFVLADNAGRSLKMATRPLA